MDSPAHSSERSGIFGIGADFPRYAEVRALLSGMLRAADLAVLVTSAVFAYWTRIGKLDMPAPYLIAIGIAALLLLNVGRTTGLYRFEGLAHFPSQLGAASLSIAAVLAVLAVLGYLTKTAETFSRLWLTTWLFLAYSGIVVTRVAAARRMEAWRARGGLRRRIAVVGAGIKCKRLLDHLLDSPESELKVVGVFDGRGGVPDPNDGIPVSGTMRDLIASAHRLDIDEIVVALPNDDQEALIRVMSELRTVPVDVSMCPDTVGLAMPILGVDDVNGVGLLRIYRRPMSGWNRVLKAVEDRLLALVLLALFSPLLAVIALAIRLDSSGPVFFRQKRLGFSNNTFVLLKFRTMLAGAESDPAVPQARRRDPRVTRVGAFLRRTSLDELPQLINVLRGEMSIVGPRPHAIAHNERYAALVDQYLGRHRVKPGITGWAQVHGLRGETDTLDKMRARVEYDLYYIDHWSLWFDLRILMLTPFVGFVHRNAY